MKQIYDSRYLTLAHDNAKRCIYVTWKPPTQTMDASEYRQEIENYVEQLVQYKPLLYMNDMREFYFTITPDLQEWVGEKFRQLYQNPAMPQDTFSAIVMSKDFFAHVSVEQTVDESSLNGKSNKERLRYFETVGEAERWLGLH